MRNRIIVLFTLVFFVVIRSTYAYDIKKQKAPSSSLHELGRTATYMTEESSGWIGALVGQCVGFFVGGQLFPFDWRSVYFGQFFVGAMGATAGTVFTGKILRQKGSPAGALIGGTLGSLIAGPGLFIMVIRNRTLRSALGLYGPSFGWWPYFSTCISTGAVIGYNYEALKSNKMELIECLVGCAVASATLNILIGRLTGGVED